MYIEDCFKLFTSVLHMYYVHLYKMKYRISSINSRGYYSFLYVKSAASIWGRPLFKGGYYYKISKKLREIAPKRDNFCKISTIFIAKFAK